MQKHFVHFLSPGTFCAEETRKDIDSWSVEQACAMASTIIERHGVRPYAFFFTTRERADDALDSKETKRSGYYHLGGAIRDAEQIKAMPNGESHYRILLGNMESNGWEKVIFNQNSWLSIQPLRDGDVFIPFEMPAAKEA
jgi:hypothetical protein